MECSKTTGDEAQTKPPAERHDAVVYDMENSDLPEVLLHDEKYRVEQFDKFREEE